MTTTVANLEALPRDETGKGAARQLRRDGRVPAVVYGKDMETVMVSVDALAAQHLFESISVDNTIIHLAVDGDADPHQTLVREIQTHPYKNDLIHIDFLRIQEGVMVDVDIPVYLEGTPEGVKSSGGVLDQIINELPVRCIPSKIPESFVIDVSALEVYEAIHVYDLELEEGVEVTIDEDRTICSVTIPKAPVLDEEEAEEEAAEPELIGDDGEPLEGEELEEAEAAAEAEAADDDAEG